MATQRLLRSENGSLAEFGLAPPRIAIGKFFAGFLAGSLLVIVLALVARVSLPMHWDVHPAATWGGIMFGLVHHMITNTCEELGFRGYGFDRLRRLIGLWPAQAAVAGVSACFHVVCGWSWTTALIHTTAGSVLFALVFVRWRSIPAAIGVHAAWNWTRDLILSFPAGQASFFAPIQDRPWGSSEWFVAQCILAGGTLAVCAVLVIGVRRRVSAAGSIQEIAIRKAA
jgi:membrane protease YdiL (CAAX protease family)